MDLNSMKKLLLTLALLLTPSFAWAQCNGVFSPHTVCGNNSASPAIPGMVAQGTIIGPGGTAGQIQYNNSGFFGRFTPSIPLASYGVDPAVSDNTAAMNIAIDAANAAGGNVSLIVPQGTTNVCTLHPILVSKVYFVSLGAPETSFFNMTCNTAGVAHFQWSDTTHNIDGGGMINVGLIGTGNVNQLSIYAPWAARLDFINMKISNIGTLGIFGVTNTKSTQGIFFGHLHGDVATVATPLFQLN